MSTTKTSWLFSPIIPAWELPMLPAYVTMMTCLMLAVAARVVVVAQVKVCLTAAYRVCFVIRFPRFFGLLLWQCVIQGLGKLFEQLHLPLVPRTSSLLRCSLSVHQHAFIYMNAFLPLSFVSQAVLTWTCAFCRKEFSIRRWCSINHMFNLKRQFI